MRSLTRWVIAVTFAFAAVAVATVPALAADPPAGLPVKPPSGPIAEQQTDAWMKIIRDKADHGSWLVVRGTHIGDQTVAALTAAKLSHAAVLDKEKEEVIEAV